LRQFSRIEIGPPNLAGDDVRQIVAAFCERRSGMAVTHRRYKKRNRRKKRAIHAQQKFV